MQRKLPRFVWNFRHLDNRANNKKW